MFSACSRNNFFFFDAGKPPEVMPVRVVAVDIHVTLVVVPLVEGLVAPLPFGIFPVGGVGVGVGEGRIGFVDSGQGEWVGGNESPQFVFSFELVVGEPSHRFESELKEVDFHFFVVAPRHGVHDILVSVLLAPGGVEGLLVGARKVDGDAAADIIFACQKLVDLHESLFLGRGPGKEL